MTNKAIFLDRDGVLNYAAVVDGIPQSPRSISEIKLLPKVRESIEYFKSRGYINVVITNQPDFIRGAAQKNTLESINSYILEQCGIAHSYICWHDDSDYCQCRKPEPGLIYQAADELNISLENSLLVGDRWRDIAAGNKAGLNSYFIDRKYQERTPEPPFETIESIHDLCRKI